MVALAATSTSDDDLLGRLQQGEEDAWAELTRNYGPRLFSYLRHNLPSAADAEDALSEMARMCREQHWQLAVWDLEQGLQLSGQENQANTNGDSNTDPLAAIRAIQGLASADSSAILAMVNFHRFLNSAEIVQAVARQIMLGKQTRTLLVVLSPVVQIPVELEREFLVLEHELPDRGQLETLARSIATEENELPEGAELTQIMDAAAFALCSLPSFRRQQTPVARPSVMWMRCTSASSKSVVAPGSTIGTTPPR